MTWEQPSLPLWPRSRGSTCGWRWLGKWVSFIFLSFWKVRFCEWYIRVVGIFGFMEWLSDNSGECHKSFQESKDQESCWARPVCGPLCHSADELSRVFQMLGCVQIPATDTWTSTITPVSKSNRELNRFSLFALMWCRLWWNHLKDEDRKRRLSPYPRKTRSTTIWYQTGKQ